MVGFSLEEKAFRMEIILVSSLRCFDNFIPFV
jgi:hypothetical protein